MSVLTVSVLLVGVIIGFVCGLLLAFWWLLEAEAPLKEWRYACTCGWACVFVSSVTLAPSFLRCDECKGIAVRRREPEGVTA